MDLLLRQTEPIRGDNQVKCPAR